MPDDDLDASALLAALDATEAAGVPPHLVERLREMVRAEAARRDRRRGTAGERLRRGDLLARRGDGLLYAYDLLTDRRVDGMAIRDLRAGETAPLDPMGHLG